MQLNCHQKYFKCRYVTLCWPSSSLAWEPGVKWGLSTFETLESFWSELMSLLLAQKYIYIFFCKHKYRWLFASIWLTSWTFIVCSIKAGLLSCLFLTLLPSFINIMGKKMSLGILSRIFILQGYALSMVCILSCLMYWSKLKQLNAVVFSISSRE